MGSQAPVMPDAWMRTPTLPRLWSSSSERGQFLAQGSRSYGSSPRAGAPPLQTYAWMQGMAGLSPVPCHGRQLVSSPSLWAFSLLPQWELEESEGWLGPSFSSSPADPAAFTDTLLTGIDWLGLSEGNPKRGLCL